MNSLNKAFTGTSWIWGGSTWRLNLIKDCIAFTDFWHHVEPSTYCSEYVIAIEVTTIGDIVDRETWVKEDSLLFGPLSILFQDSVIQNSSFSASHKRVLNALFDLFATNPIISHNFHGAVLIEIVWGVHALISKIGGIVKPLLTCSCFVILWSNLINASLSDWFKKECTFNYFT